MRHMLAPGAPIYAISNLTFSAGAGLRALAERWLTTVNYDVLIYPDSLLVVRGLSWRAFPDYRKERQEGREHGRPASDVHVARVRRASETPMEQLLAADRRNRMIQTDEIVYAPLKRRWGFCALTIHVIDGERLKFTWVNNSRRNGDYNEIAAALASVLGDRLKATPPGAIAEAARKDRG